MVHDGCNYFSFWAIFCPFTSLTPWKIKILKKWKMPGDIIILHMCTTNYDQMMYGSWDMVFDKCNYFSSWTIFLPFYLPNSQKNQNFEKKMERKPGDIIILHMCTTNYDHMMYGSWDKVRDRCKLLFLFLGYFLHFYLPNSPKNQNFEKMKKIPGDIILNMCTKNYDQMMYASWDMVIDR